MPIIGSSLPGPVFDYAGYAAFTIGYVFGYLIDGYLKYTIVRRRIPATKLAPGEPWVLYDKDGRKAIAIQTNRALFHRLFLDNHVFLLCKTPFGEGDWLEPTKYPLFPLDLFTKRMTMVDNFQLVDVKYSSDIGKERHPRRQAMLVTKAHGSLVSIDQLCFEADAVAIANAATAEAQRKYTNLVHFVKSSMPRFFANFLAETYDKAPGMSFMEASARAEELRKEVEQGNRIELLSEEEKLLKYSEGPKEIPHTEQPKTDGDNNADSQAKGQNGQDV
jgi:hypothetical protein